MTSSMGSELVRLVGASEREGMARERRRVGKGLALERVQLPAIDTVRLIEQEVVREIGAKGLREATPISISSRRSAAADRNPRW